MTLARLRSERPDASIVFFIRDPVTRFVSAFNSRLREGRPRNYNPWMPEEAAAFQKFSSPNALAESFTNPDENIRRAGEQAMWAIGHLRLGYSHYLGSIELLKQAADSIAMIGQLERFEADLAKLRQLLSIDPDIPTPADDVAIHRTPNNMETHLSELGRRNITERLTADYQIYNWCVARQSA